MCLAASVGVFAAIPVRDVIATPLSGIPGRNFILNYVAPALAWLYHLFSLAHRALDPGIRRLNLACCHRSGAGGVTSSAQAERFACKLALVIDHVGLSKELSTLRWKGLTRLRTLDVPQLSEAARIVYRGEILDESAAVERLVGLAIGRLGGGEASESTGRLFGATGGLRAAGPKRRREQAADALGKSAETLRTRHQTRMVSDLAHAILVLIEDHVARPDSKTVGAASGATEEMPEVAAASTAMAIRLPASDWFTGRSDDLSELDKALVRRDSGGVPVAIVSGFGGMGKSSLVLHWSRTRAAEFPDGLLYVDLRGFSPSGEPMSSSEALRILLQQLGLDIGGLPSTRDELQNLYRQRISTRRVLVIADNARDYAQMELLMPSGNSCVLVVTSRNQLPGLQTRRAILIDLRPLASEDARDLLIGDLATSIQDTDSDAIDAILEACGGVPLAIAIVASLVRQHPTFPLAALATELRNRTNRLDVLDGGDLGASIRAVLASSYVLLDEEASTAFKLLGSAPVNHMSAEAAASLLNRPNSETVRILRRLERASLVRQPFPGTYEFHDLIRLFALELREADSPQLVEDDLLRVTTYYLQMAYVADRTLGEFRRPISLDVQSEVDTSRLLDELAAMEWFTTEHDNVLELQRLAASYAWNALVWQLAWTMDNFHWRTGQVRVDVESWALGLQAARRADDRSAEGLSLRRLGRALARVGDHDAAVQRISEAVSITHGLGDLPGEAHCHRDLASLFDTLGKGKAALAEAELSVALYEESGNPVWTAHALSVLGDCLSSLGRSGDASTYWERSLNLHRQFRHEEGEAETLRSLGEASHRLGSFKEAIDLYEQSLVISQRSGNSYDSADTLERLGVSLLADHRSRDAANVWNESLKFYKNHGRDVDAGRVEERLGGL